MADATYLMGKYINGRFQSCGKLASPNGSLTVLAFKAEKPSMPSLPDTPISNENHASSKLTSQQQQQHTQRPPHRLKDVQLRVFLFQMIMIIVSIGRLVIHTIAVYLWHLEQAVISYVGFAAILSASPLILTVVRTATEEIKRQQALSRTACIRLLLLIPPLLWFAQFFRDLWVTNDWWIATLCWLPLGLRLVIGHYAPAHSILLRMW